LCWYPHRWYPKISSAHGVKVDSRMMDKILYVVDKSDMPITIICFIHLPFRQFLSIANRINKFNDLTANCSNSYLNQFCRDWSNPGDLCVSFIIVLSPSKALGSGTCGSAVCIFVCLTSLTPSTFNSSEKWFLYLAKILWQSVMKSPFSLLL
jgi:hypothetical protein